MYGSKTDFSADREFARLMVAGLVILIVAVAGVVMSTFANAAIRSFGVIMVTMVTGGMGGAAIGFLFGIPRVLTDAGSVATTTAASGDASGTPAEGSGAGADPDSTGSRRLLASNSNLEQVSDWLTKIILGVGLTQFYQLDGMLYRFESLVARHVGPADQVTPMIAAILIVFSIICGFLAMYLETRLVLSRIFNSVERDLLDELKKTRTQVTRATTQIDAERAQKDDALERADQLETAVKTIADATTTSATTLAPAAESLKTAAASDQASPELKSIAAQALAASGRTSEADDLVQTGAGASVRERISAMQVALYKAPPSGFREALATAASLSDDPAAQGSAEYWFYQAAAFGQQHHYLLSTTDDAAECDLASARDNALDCVRRCLAIDKSYEIRFFLLMNPSLSTAPDDDDLIDFATDDAFRAIVRDPSASAQADPGRAGPGTAAGPTAPGAAPVEPAPAGVAPGEAATTAASGTGSAA